MLAERSRRLSLVLAAICLWVGPLSAQGAKASGVDVGSYAPWDSGSLTSLRHHGNQL